ncbi:MAG: transglutaminase-like cysteine peptidase, partial [Rhodospirillales bacterium]
AKYISDRTNWGRKDYWATPAEFMANFGDCEDYAIIKYLSLRNLGFREEELRVVAVKDLNLKVGHAVLVVVWKDPKTGKKRSLLLDNQIKKVVDSRAVRHYKPVFSINKDYWWRHRS